MATELPKAYNPAETEGRIYELWEKSGFFNPDNLPQQDGKPFTIIMPPPNANAPLHIGHALTFTVEDILIRFHRMRGRKTLWLPGMDHAGFETQAVFEKQLEKEGRSRFSMEREEFYKEIWDFVQKNKHLSEEGLKKLGASCDWSRNIFTLDPRIVSIVYETFTQMHKDGLVYRAGRICNWCNKHQTGLADLETKYEERQDSLYYLKYGPFTIATARPETKFGDKYVVMHPDDTRYAQYTDGQKIDLEWINGPITATVVKDSAIDMTFGTGVMTITPAHDATDFDIAKRHNLDIEQILDRRGKLLPIAGEFAGMKITEARPKIIEKLRAKGLLENVDENYRHNIQTCYKCNTVIEPQIVPQWYIKMTEKLPDGRSSLRDMAVNAVESGEITFVSEKFKNLFMSWMKDLRDWPISRQLWWGIPIPVWYRGEETKISAEKPAGDGWAQDQDTFDTWFSSGQWPYATLMAHGENDFKTYFPTQIMETGWDIIFFWVARMIMLSYYRTNKYPFETVYLHGLIRDAQKQKISKSKGNVINPFDLAEKYGTDALRMALIFSSAAGSDIPLAEDKVKGMKHFANKIWNVARYILGKVPGDWDQYKKNGSFPISEITGSESFGGPIRTVAEEITSNLEKYRLHEAAQIIYDYLWHSIADKYLEHTKDKDDEETRKNLVYYLVASLKFLHPFMPFVTEEIWSKLPFSDKKLLLVEDWPVTN